MTRLYIVDQSLIKRGGHHYDYTTCVAQAAASMGFETVVVANEKLTHDAHFPNTDLHRVFKNTVYQRDSYLAGLRQLKRSRFELTELASTPSKPWRGLQNFYRRTRSQQRRIRLIRQFADDCRSFFSRCTLGESDHVFFTTVSELEMLGLADYLASDVRTLSPTWHLQFHFNIFDGRTPEYDSQSAAEELTKVCFESAFEKVAYHRLRCHTTSLPLAQQYNRMKVCEVTPLPYPVAPEFASQFARSPIERAVGGQPNNDWPAALLPHFSKKRSATSIETTESSIGPSSRSSLLGSSSDNDSRQRQGRGSTDPGRSGDDFGGDDGGGDDCPTDFFDPASMVATDCSADNNRRGRPLRFTCPGQIRREKGCFEYLQPLVNEIWETHLATQQIKIAVQRPKKKGLRKQKMKLLPPPSIKGDDAAATGAVEYFDHPLGREAYIDFIKNTDCGLLFYDSRTYYSRRAGVLGELLSAGKPLIVSGGSWLSEQVAEPNFRWAQSLSRRSDSVRTLQIQDVQYSGLNVPSAGGVVSFDQVKHPFRFRLPRRSGEQIMVFKFDWKFPTQNGTYAGIEVVQKDANGNAIGKKRNVVGHREDQQSPNCLFRLYQETQMIDVSLRNEFSDSTASFRNLRIEMLSMRDVENSAQIPLASVGIIAADRDDLVAGVDEMVMHYQHYRSSAEQFSRHWFAMHNPARCVARLIANRW